ncbi:PQQ-binding-like beta-propeller repeat protein [Yinghuangia sp. ASG 101]|uniref:caspase, EACC1-associated type n=1 Tax=Yinghuangia sp. ASG 101 TaxID=2896848 RepID=UPI001E62BD53|nr:PQQ-binding-like beta-propeller repeat protein [Yinghuangia sp. ASG 101]UGQ09077.1 PQQ-binding-like beta-propeller repeat protein [Yinghuangia sp. ASG 101]
MTDALSDRGVRAVLFGTGSHAAGSQLPSLPSVDTTIDDLHKALVEVCGMDPAQITRVPADADPAQVIAAVEGATEQPGGPVLFYYVGHGLLDPDDELYLATRGSRGQRRVAHAVPYRTVRNLLGKCRHGSVVVLDCCFSGRGTAPPSGGGARGPFATARPPGSFFLTSATYFEQSFAPEGERHTLFSGQLLRLLRDGDPAGPLWLTTAALHKALDRAFAENPLVQPTRGNEGTLDSLLLARNRAYPVGADEAWGAEPPADVPCPYPGLEPFRAEDSAHFFGRDDLAARLTNAVADETEDGPVLLIGASGAGKSSLLRAGLLPRLEDPAGPGHGPALLIPAPGENPMRTLAGPWAAAHGLDEDETHDALQHGRFPPPRPGRPTCRVLVIDQFEEVFTRCRDPHRRTAFLDLLTGNSDRPGPRPKIVLGVRADHYGNCLAHPGLEHALAHAVTVPPMSEPHLRAAVEEPAAAAGLTLEPGLTDRLLRDLHTGHHENDAAAALPFLAHALRETWRRRSGTRLTLAGYQATGGIWESVATTGENLHHSLDEDGQRTLRELLLLLVHVPTDSETAVVRHRVPLTDLPDTTTEIRERLARDRLLTVNRTTAHIAHESLLRAWPRLRDWIHEDTATLLARQQLRAAAKEWDTNARKPEYLYRGSRLHAAEQLDNLPTREHEFLQASRRRARRSTQRRIFIPLLAILTAITTTLAFVAYQQAAEASRNGAEALRQAGEAARQHTLAFSRQLAAESLVIKATQPVTARRLAAAAWFTAHTDQARDVMTQLLDEQQRNGILPVSPGGVKGVAFSPDGNLLATAGEDGTLRLWNPNTRQPASAPLTAATGGSVNGVAFSPNGSLLATAGEDGTLRLWNPNTRQPTSHQILAAPVGSVEGVAFSPDGNLLATTNNDGTVKLWNPHTGQPATAPLPATPGSSVNAIAFSPDGNLLATAGGDGTVKLWNPHTGQPASHQILATPGSSVNAMAFSPNGNLLATTGEDGTVKLWNPHTGQPVGTPLPAAPGGSVKAMAFSPNGNLLATTNGIVRLWNPNTGQPASHQIPHDWNAGGVDGVAFSPDGNLLATANYDGTVRLWDPHTGRPVAIAPFPLNPSGEVYAGVDEVAFSPDGNLLAAANYDGTVRLWDPHTGQPASHQIPAIQGASVDGVAFSPDGNLLATTDDDGTVRLWNPHTGQLTGAPLATTPGGSVNAMAFSPDGNLLATTDDDGTLQMWNPKTRQPASAPLPATQGGSVDGVAFSPDGNLLATAGEDGTIYLAETRLFTDPYAALCSDVGPPTPDEWKKHAPGEPQTDVCKP